VTPTFISLVVSLLEAVRESANTTNNAKNGNTNICVHCIVSQLLKMDIKVPSHQDFIEELLPELCS